MENPPILFDTSVLPNVLHADTLSSMPTYLPTVFGYAPASTLQSIYSISALDKTNTDSDATLTTTQPTWTSSKRPSLSSMFPATSSSSSNSHSVALPSPQLGAPAPGALPQAAPHIDEHPRTALIVSLIVLGVCILIALLLLIWLAWRRQKVQRRKLHETNVSQPPLSAKTNITMKQLELNLVPEQDTPFAQSSLWSSQRLCAKVEEQSSGYFNAHGSESLSDVPSGRRHDPWSPLDIKGSRRQSSQNGTERTAE